MRVAQTTNKKLVFAILLSVLTVGLMLTLGRVPLAVSQPVTIPAKAVKGAIPMDGANPIWESVPGVVVPLSGQLITTPMHPNISVKSVFVKAMTNGKEIGLRLEWIDQTKNDTAIGPQDFRDQVAVMFPVNTAARGRSSRSRATSRSAGSSRPKSVTPRKWLKRQFARAPNSLEVCPANCGSNSI